MAVAFSINIKGRQSAAPAAQPKQAEGLHLKGTGGATVFLVHGLTGTPQEMKFLANFFNRKMGYSVVCPRLANHGEPIQVLKKTSWQEFYDSVRDAFVSLRETTEGPIFVSGLSMGALLSLLLAQEFAGQIAGVSCLSPTLFYDGWNVPWYSSLVLPLFYLTPLKHVAYFKEEPPYGFKNEALRKRVHKYFSTASLKDHEGVSQYGYPFFPMTLLHQLQLLVKYLKNKLPLIHAPVQLIQAKDDDMTSVKNATFIYDRVRSELKEIVLLHNSYHVITADQERDTVALKMDDFFRRIMGMAEAKKEQYAKEEPDGFPVSECCSIST